MPGKLYIIANATGVGLNFANTENSGDNLPVNPNGIVITGGVDGNFCLIPTCESAGEFAAHHMSVLSADSSVNICFWKNNTQRNIVYYSTKADFNQAATLPGGNVTTYDRAALLIYETGGVVNVQMSDVDSSN